jgi:hypothetical protein
LQQTIKRFQAPTENHYLYTAEGKRDASEEPKAMTSQES